jgi:uncharacterized RDD family membrane protein YckC
VQRHKKPDIASASPDLSNTHPGLRRRMACWLYEGMLLFGVVFIAGYLFGTLSQTRNAMDNRHALQAFIFVVFGVYFGWFWARGQTLAMKTWRIRVRTVDGNPLSQSRAVFRYLVSWLWFLPPLIASEWLSTSTSNTLMLSVTWVITWALISKLRSDGRFVHDVLAGTQLINEVT